MLKMKLLSEHYHLERLRQFEVALSLVDWSCTVVMKFDDAKEVDDNDDDMMMRPHDHTTPLLLLLLLLIVYTIILTGQFKHNYKIYVK